MCGRFASVSSSERIEESLEVDIVKAEPREPDYNVAPQSDIYTVRAERDELAQRVLERMRWGFVPSWAKDRKIGNRMINARAETINEKPVFKKPLSKKRCIIPADGFYEWKPVPGEKRKQPFFIRRKDGELLAFAGLYESWRDPDEPEDNLVNSCLIITTAPNEVMKPIHDRMPVILPESVWEKWLDPKNDDPEALLKLLVPADNALLEAYPVRKLVNDPKNHAEELIIPDEHPS